ncbi:MATE family efflux transporter [Acinetobacter seifertii]|uniref:MATE family efflux transporter n=1 Tax=Acinetobacter seifertii TaxID=1530123 RepID=UPI00157FF803|nr:MATE family efflux transporter [Acinetobacter seifertii]NUE92956.1 MATE family efflux transporter [Acinetobacter seifertii]
MNQIFKLFIPMLSSNLILVLSGLVDIAYVGHFSNDHVAALSVTLSLYTVIYVIGMGILQGVILKLSEAYGCHDIPHIRQIFIQGIWLMLCSALVSIGLLYLFRDLPKLFGASEHVVSITKNCIWVLVFILPAHLLMRLCTALSQVTENAHKVLLSDSIFFILKIILSYLLIYGVALFSIPPLGAIGALLATLIVRWFMLAVYYLFFLEKSYIFIEQPERSVEDGRQSLRMILKIGIPTAIMALMDVVAFCSVAILILPFGSVVSAAHQIVASTGGFMFIFPSSIASAYSILVSRSMGSGNMEEANKIARQSIWVIMAVSGSLSLGLWLERDLIVTFYSDDLAVQVLAASLLLIVCISHFLDGFMTLLTSLLRCWDVSILPMLIFLVVVLCFGLGGGWWMAYKGLHWQDISISAMGIYGFWSMAAISYLVACLMSALCFRFRKQLKGF